MGKRDLCCCADAVPLRRLTKSASNAEVEDVIKEWLCTCTTSDHSGGRRQREAVKCQHLAGNALGQDTSAAVLLKRMKQLTD